MVYDEHLLSSGSLKVLVCARQCVPIWSTSSKILGTESLMSTPGRQHSTCFVPNNCWEGRSYPVKLHWEKTLGRLYLISSELCPMRLFPLLSLLWSSQSWLSMTEYSMTLCFLVNHWNWGWSWGTSDTIYFLMELNLVLQCHVSIMQQKYNSCLILS